MDAIKRILLPTDFSEGADQALQQAVVLADLLNAELHLLHVLTGPASTGDAMIGFSEMEEYRNRMREASSRHYRSLPVPRQRDGLPVQCAVRIHTQVHQGILEYAAGHRIDLIVLAPDKGRLDGHFVSGSTTGEVVRLAPCDVLTSGWHAASRPDALSHILVPVDFSPPSALALEQARMLAEAAQAQLSVLHVVEPATLPGQRPGEATVEDPKSLEEAYGDLELFYRFSMGPDVPHQFYVVPGGPADRIAAFAARQDVHLLVQGTHDRHGIDYAELDSVAEQIACRAPCPVLTVQRRVLSSRPDAGLYLERWQHDRPSRTRTIPVLPLELAL